MPAGLLVRAAAGDSVLACSGARGGGVRATTGAAAGYW
jgi:hypothetical protein